MFTKKPQRLSIDLETRCKLKIKDVGVYAYCRHSSFKLLLFAFKLDDEPVRLIDLHNGDTIPQQIQNWIYDPEVEKRAWNAEFEMEALSIHFGKAVDSSQWRCTMVEAGYNGLPLSLDGTGTALGLDRKKLTEGKQLITFFCVPCKPTKTNGGRTWNEPKHAPDKWALFKKYCIRDVVVESSINQKLVIRLSKREWQVYQINYEINRRGIMIDYDLVHKVQQIDAAYRDALLSRTKELTQVDNPNSVAQLKKWLQQETDIGYHSLAKEALREIVKQSHGETIDEVLKLRSEISMSSIKKFNALINYRCEDDRVRGLHKYYGASRTGRFASAGPQLHNLARNELKPKELTYLRGVVKQGINHETLSLMYNSVSGTLKELIRPAFVPAPGNKFVIGDFSSIEALVLACLAGEKWRIDAFIAKKDIYIASASKMFRIPENEITKDSPVRQRGKVSELSLGYGGGVGALSGMLMKLGLQGTIKATELEAIVAAWRLASPNICQCWYTLEKAFRYALMNPGEIVGCLRGRIKFQFYKGKMLMRLPSGRFIAYDTPEFIEGRLYARIYEKGMWLRRSIWGGLITENAVQGIARDLLTESMVKARNSGYQIVIHVHDEIGIEVSEDNRHAKNFLEKIMQQVPAWASDMPVRAEVFETNFYRK